VSGLTNPAGRAASPASVEAYRTAILLLLGDDDPLEVLAGTADRLDEAVAGLDQAVMSRLEAPGRWSIAGVLQHLADSEVVFAWRLRVTLGEDQPPLQPFDQDRGAERLHYDRADAGRALALMRALREANLPLLRSLPEEDRKRAGMHHERGPESVEMMTRLYAGHDRAHLRQIRRIRDGLGR